MQQFINEFGGAIFYVVSLVMSGVGIVDNGFTIFMLAAGVGSPSLQLTFLLLMVVAAVVLAMRLIGGGIGWFILLLCVLLLMHRVLPGMGGPEGMHVASPLQNALQQ